MYALAIRNCAGIAGTLFKSLLLAAIFYVCSADQFSPIRPEIVDVALLRYRAAVDTTLRGKLDMGGLDKKIVLIVADLDPRVHLAAVRSDLEYEVHMAFDQGFNATR
ncbi:hypothetical protein [Breoghania sp. L-A4]|uniref:hypothetical protein n=1 Tax=Breoghania sp. L-A4 TaxID=2304600 RepID=UPI000E35E72F|nr:hypothetical protein [Breoghania sp. L-A4]AXS41427.1 hypothetical protein D1F64_17200 [Breoghania sp. L-A4]